MLEIGAGCGVCGILAANLGASSVVLADCEPAVLRNLARCLALNPEVGAVRGTHRPTVEKSHAAPTTRQNIPPGCESVETEEKELVWNAGAVSIRRQDWNESPRHLASLRAVVVDSGTAQTAAADHSDPLTPQNIDMEQCFDVILGTDVLYEDPMAPLVSAVLKHRLAPGGKAYVCCAVREQVRPLGSRLHNMWVCKRLVKFRRWDESRCVCDSKGTHPLRSERMLVASSSGDSPRNHFRARLFLHRGFLISLRQN